LGFSSNLRSAFLDCSIRLSLFPIAIEGPNSKAAPENRKMAGFAVRKGKSGGFLVTRDRRFGLKIDPTGVKL
jgi:hypothetical protein